ncbi:hypothetical protein AM501_09845 [Aneurinibacillus migulanus]|uniref:hypothetical protein n=1 Tax=Aneurinibacillus migulanus TaxID=47500 RepID=UPI0005BB6D67|nr:hypothetical protein [Aneurinibacillus migulanus]KIV56447.1 hypothetical protein TS64_09260 [Aneurinibacillus migulanus]KPD08455.1 hypothetical protein AM501_09845 [Aneurinibacillus migulanus]
MSWFFSLLFLGVIILTTISIYFERRRYNKVMSILQSRFGDIAKTEFRKDGCIYVYTGKELFEVKLRQNKIIEEKLLVG